MTSSVLGASHPHGSDSVRDTVQPGIGHRIGSQPSGRRVCVTVGHGVTTARVDVVTRRVEVRGGRMVTPVVTRGVVVEELVRGGGGRLVDVGRHCSVRVKTPKSQPP